MGCLCSKATQFDDIKIPRVDLNCCGPDVRLGNKKALFRGFVSHIMRHRDTRKICVFFVVNFMFMLVELLYGMWANSLGLISDAAHMLFDCTALVLGLAASYIARWRPNDAFTYGYARAEVLSGFTNALFLCFIAVYIFVEAIERLLDPPPVDSDSLLPIAVLGLLVNLGGLVFFREQHSAACDHGSCTGEHSHSENMQAIFLHILADTLGSAGVILSSWMISRYGTRALWVDPCCSIVIAVLIGASVAPLLCRSLDLLIQAAPPLRQRPAADWLAMAARIPGVCQIRRFHCWALSSGQPVVSIHVVVADEAKLDETRRQLSAHFAAAGVSREMGHLAVELEHQHKLSVSHSYHWPEQT